MCGLALNTVFVQRTTHGAWDTELGTGNHQSSNKPTSTVNVHLTVAYAPTRSALFNLITVRHRAALSPLLQDLCNQQSSPANNIMDAHHDSSRCCSKNRRV